MSQPDVPSALATTPPVASAAGIHKRFGSTHALRGVGLALYPGRCLGLVGRNGAGKSTLVSILSGITAPDTGAVLFDGQPAPSLGDIAAWRGRIATVFQHSMVVPDLTVAELTPEETQRYDIVSVPEIAAEDVDTWTVGELAEIVEMVRSIADVCDLDVVTEVLDSAPAFGLLHQGTLPFTGREGART